MSIRHCVLTFGERPTGDASHIGASTAASIDERRLRHRCRELADGL
ncbi:MAG TPA: hypothetical protein VNQ81_15545 [Povalibacter sp.]|nr:hypothetical protein [Povalibacter sp.]